MFLYFLSIFVFSNALGIEDSDLIAIEMMNKWEWTS